MANWGKFNFRDFENLAKRFEKMSKGDVIDQFIRDFVMEIGMRALRKIKKLTQSNASGQLRSMWQIGKVERQGDSYIVEIFNNLEYASFVEYGFRAHWVPGKWEGNVFRYIPNYKPPPGEPGGMQVGPKGGWVEGRFMMSIGMKEIERELPTYLARRQKKLLEKLLRG
ncbi:HK97 gp10 family phage protein [Xylanibacillus composti]|uniref:Phage protein n=1 Tax=Xylanibacillus composti TaxID=1572762 RepID=A0A8J4M459_9BACL|nr:HK97 gp10 family phage protein [Xylanibacillus composti]GIQ70760.1 phage protein [Xylanibacillus composti]